MVSIQTRLASTKGADLVQDSSAHLRGLDFVPRDARPAGEVGENSALLPQETRLHVTPPLLTHDRSCGDTRQGGRFSRTEMPGTTVRLHTPWSLTAGSSRAGGHDATLTNAQQQC